MGVEERTVLRDFHPLVGDWFAGRYGEPTEPADPGLAAHPRRPRRADLRADRLGQDAGGVFDLPRRLGPPRGRGRAARRDAGRLRLAAQGAHQRRSQEPRDAARRTARAQPRRGIALAPIRTAARTGDTPQAERARMLRKPPHVLVTTPESLFILLTAEKSRALFARVSTVIVDEIHAMAADKRGSHLALTLARLDDLVARERRPQAAAHRPLGDGPPARRGRAVPQPRPPTSSTSATAARWISRSRCRSDELGPVASNEMWGEIYDRVAELDPRTPHDARLRQHAAAERARRVRARPRGSARASCCRITAACRATCASTPKTASRTANCAPSSRRRRSSSASTSARSISSCRLGIAALDRGRAAAHRPLRPLGRREARRAVSSRLTRDELIECAALVRAHPQRRDGRAGDPGRAARHSRAADRRVRAPRDEWDDDALFATGAHRLSVPRPRAQRLRRRRRRCSPTASRPRAGAAARSCTAIG